jgi:hypothetical protein
MEIIMETSELTGAALDWAVAKCEGYFDMGMASVHGVADGVARSLSGRG